MGKYFVEVPPEEIYLGAPARHGEEGASMGKPHLAAFWNVCKVSDACVARASVVRFVTGYALKLYESKPCNKSRQIDSYKKEQPVAIGKITNLYDRSLK